MYHYRCEIMRVIDGDTVEAIIDLGFRCLYKSAVRLKGIDAPELSLATRQAGEAAKLFLAQALAQGPVTIQTELRNGSLDKYGRVLGTFWVGGVNINEAMIQAGHAVPYL